MKAAILDRPGGPLRIGELAQPVAGRGEVLIEIEACGVCRTDLHLLDGEIETPHLPLVPGHEIVGRVAAVGPGAERFREGERVGVPWLAWTCGECRYCRGGRENLCERAVFTGQGRDGGYAEYTVADERFCLPLAEELSAAHAAPLLCAGLIGYRALRLAGEAERLGIYGFGAAGHIIAQVAAQQGREVFAFTRRGDAEAQALALELGAAWAGGSAEAPPAELDAALIFAPVGELVPAALRATARGGTVVCAGIHMSPIPAMAYELLWGERTLRSVANLTRADGAEFLELVPKLSIETQVHVNPLESAPAALESLRTGRVRGAEVLVP
jgi:propanol-preferring alcohol dehydrogenase